MIRGGLLCAGLCLPQIWITSACVPSGPERRPSGDPTMIAATLPDRSKADLAAQKHLRLAPAWPAPRCALHVLCSALLCPHLEIHHTRTWATHSTRHRRQRRGPPTWPPRADYVCFTPCKAAVRCGCSNAWPSTAAAGTPAPRIVASAQAACRRQMVCELRRPCGEQIEPAREASAPTSAEVGPAKLPRELEIESEPSDGADAAKPPLDQSMANARATHTAQLAGSKQPDLSSPTRPPRGHGLNSDRKNAPG